MYMYTCTCDWLTLCRNISDCHCTLRFEVEERIRYPWWVAMYQTHCGREAWTCTVHACVYVYACMKILYLVTCTCTCMYMYVWCFVRHSCIYGVGLHVLRKWIYWYTCTCTGTCTGSYACECCHVHILELSLIHVHVHVYMDSCSVDVQGTSQHAMTIHTCSSLALLQTAIHYAQHGPRR